MPEANSCEQCPVYQKFQDDDKASIAAAIYERFPDADSRTVDLFLENEERIRQEVLGAAEGCSGYRPLSGILKFATKLFDGPSGLQFLEEVNCGNSVYHNPEFSERAEASRSELSKSFSE